MLCPGKRNSIMAAATTVAPQPATNPGTGPAPLAQWAMGIGALVAAHRPWPLGVVATPPHPGRRAPFPRTQAPSFAPAVQKYVPPHATAPSTPTAAATLGSGPSHGCQGPAKKKKRCGMGHGNQSSLPPPARGTSSAPGPVANLLRPLLQLWDGVSLASQLRQPLVLLRLQGSQAACPPVLAWIDR